MMKNIKDLSQIVLKVRQASWRVQRQWIGLVLLGIVLIAMVAGIYLNVTARATVFGREILNMTAENDMNKRINSDLSTQLASLTSAEIMRERAEELGFQPVTSEDITYITVPGYTGAKAVDFSTLSSGPKPSLLRSDYFETLFDWFTRQIIAGAMP
jgi:cell division protein FtsL